MIVELRRALAELKRGGDLPPESQQRIAAVILEEVEQREWDALVSSEPSITYLTRLIAEAEMGNIEEGGWDR